MPMSAPPSPAVPTPIPSASHTDVISSLASAMPVPYAPSPQYAAEPNESSPVYP